MYYVYVTDKIVKKCHSYANYTHVDVCVFVCAYVYAFVCAFMCVGACMCV